MTSNEVLGRVSGSFSRGVRPHSIRNAISRRVVDSPGNLQNCTFGLRFLSLDDASLYVKEVKIGARES
jgi:hypothetical protein